MRGRSKPTWIAADALQFSMGNKSRMPRDWDELRERFGVDPSAHGWSATAFNCPRPEIELPPSYRSFMRVVGPGTLSGFVRLQPPGNMSLYRERLAPFMDAELAEALADSGDVLIFADSDNGDYCGWHLEELRQVAEPRVVRIAPRSFDANDAAPDFPSFIDRLISGVDLFGIGPLDCTYELMRPFGRLASS